MIYLTDHRLEENSDEYTESILRLYFFFGRIISSAKLVLICWITNLDISIPNLPHSSVCFSRKQSKLVRIDIHACQCETQIRCASSRSSSQLPSELKHFPSLNSSKRRKLLHRVHRATNLHLHKFVAHLHSNTRSAIKIYSRQQCIVS